MDGNGSVSGGLPETPMATYGNSDIFIVKFNSSGAHQWSKRLGGASGGDWGKSITKDSSDNIIVTGYVSGDADLNGDNDSTDGYVEDVSGTTGYNIFIVKFNSSGTCKWTKRIARPGYGGWGSISITADPAGDVIVTGFVVDNADLNGDGDSTDGGPESSTGYGSMDIFITKFNSSGTYQWAKRLGSTDNDIGYGVTTDSSSNVYVTGAINGNVDLNGDRSISAGLPETTTATYGNYDIFIVKFTK